MRDRGVAERDGGDVHGLRYWSVRPDSSLESTETEGMIMRAQVVKSDE